MKCWTVAYVILSPPNLVTQIYILKLGSENTKKRHTPLPPLKIKNPPPELAGDFCSYLQLYLLIIYTIFIHYNFNSVCSVRERTYNLVYHGAVGICYLRTLHTIC